MSWWVLLADGALAFSLNLIQITILKRLSALTYMFAGYAKGFLTVAISVLFYHEEVDGLEIFGYVVMLLGQFIWSLRKIRLQGAAVARARFWYEDQARLRRGFGAGGPSCFLRGAGLHILRPCQA